MVLLRCWLVLVARVRVVFGVIVGGRYLGCLRHWLVSRVCECIGGWWLSLCDVVGWILVVAFVVAAAWCFGLGFVWGLLLLWCLFW